MDSWISKDFIGKATIFFFFLFYQTQTFYNIFFI